MSGATNVFHVIQHYLGQSIVGVLGIVFCVICWKMNFTNKKRAAALGVGFLLIFNDISYYVAKQIGEVSTFYRFCWILPFTMAAALLIMTVFTLMKSNWQRGVFIALMLVTFGLCSNTSLKQLVKLPETQYFIPKETIDICKIIEADRGENESVILYMEDELMYGIREYDAHIKVLTTSDYKIFDQILLYNTADIDSIVFQSAVCNSGTQYLAVKKEYYVAQSALTTGGCTEIGTSENYIVYRTNLEESKKILKSLSWGSEDTE